MAASAMLEGCKSYTREHARAGHVDDLPQRTGVSHGHHGRCGTRLDIWQRLWPCLHNVGGCRVKGCCSPMKAADVLRHAPACCPSPL
jgi:hypothetical protein